MPFRMPVSAQELFETSGNSMAALSNSLPPKAAYMAYVVL